MSSLIAAHFRSPLALRIVAALALAMLGAVTATQVVRAADPLGSPLETASGTVELLADGVTVGEPDAITEPIVDADTVETVVAPVVSTVEPIADTVETVVAPVVSTVEPIDVIGDAAAGAADDSFVASRSPGIMAPTTPRLMDAGSPATVNPVGRPAAAGRLVREVSISGNPRPAPISLAEPNSGATLSVVRPSSPLGSPVGGGGTFGSTGGSDMVPIGLLGSVLLVIFLWRVLSTSPLVPPSSVLQLVPVPPG